jgi:hypothetical protein
MSQYDELLKWCRSRRLTMLDDLKPLEAGKMTMGSNDGSGWRDITQAWIAETKRRIAELDTLIAAYEKRGREEAEPSQNVPLGFESTAPLKPS